nr:retrotransposon protein, putative, unclassified [Tanacetum cinerariifolium]
NLQAPTASMSFQDSAPVPTNSSNTTVSSHNVDATSQPHAQQQRNLTPLPIASVADNVPNAVLEGDLFVNLFGTPSQWTKDDPLEQVIREPSNMHTFLHGSLKEDVYVCQLEGFIDADYPSHVYKLKKALYGLKQAPRAWYDELSTFLLQNGFSKGTTDPTLFIIRFDYDILVVHVYVDDIIFGSTNPRYATLFSDLMKSHFEMSKMGEMTFFFGLQVNQSPSDADYAGCKDTFKSTSGGAQFLGEKLVSWSSKKQDCTSLSTAESKYVSLSACCAQVLWMRTQLTDYGYYFDKIPIYFQNQP